MTTIAVLARMVPDLVEELEIAPDGKSLDLTWLRLIINEFDNHAIEQAVLLKEQLGGEVIVISPEAEGVEDMLYTAAAKGADRLIKIIDLGGESLPNHALARAYAAQLKAIQPDLILTGVQANNDLDGSAGPLVAELLGFGYTGYISSVSLKEDRVVATKEYPGGLLAEVEVKLPAVLGIQAAEQPPRYVAISKVRQMMTTVSIEETAAAELDPSGRVMVEQMYLPEPADRAEMIGGSEQEITGRLIEIFREKGVL